MWCLTYFHFRFFSDLVGQKFRHAISMGQGCLGQSWRNLRTCLQRIFFQPKHHNVQLIVHLNIRAPVGANNWGFCNPQLPDPKEALLFFFPPTLIEKC